MKANELMIGDWVDFYHPYEPEKKIITRHRITETFECGLVGISDHDNPVHADHIEPVKITQEILEKNGFKEGKLNISPQYCLDDNNVFIGVTLEDIPDKHKGIDITKGRQYFQLDISRMKEPLYVHQLQHALRLCGINKEILL